jgi:hypothetical protein
VAASRRVPGKKELLITLEKFNGKLCLLFVSSRRRRLIPCKTPNSILLRDKSNGLMHRFHFCVFKS